MSHSKEVDLTIDPRYRGQLLVEAAWDWPAATRAIILLIDALAAAEEPVAVDGLGPASVAVTGEGALKIRKQTAGNGPFMPPEVLAGESAGETALVYSLGAIYFHLLVGWPPLGDIWRLEQYVPGVPLRLKDIILKAVNVEPEQRYSSLSALRQDLVDVLVPLTWWERAIPRLPIAETSQEQWLERGYRLQQGYLRFRDRFPWVRAGSGVRRVREFFRQLWVRQLVTLGSSMLFLALLTALFAG